MNSKSTLCLNLLTFFCLYIAQAIPTTFFSTSLQVMMRESNYSLTTIGLLSFIKLPWMLKFLWAPMVDKKCVTLKGFKRFIISSEIIYALLLFMVGFLNIQTELTSIIILIILSLIASATQDIATDALAILSFKQNDRGLVNSVQSMGSFTGTLIGCGVLLIILHKFG